MARAYRGMHTARRWGLFNLIGSGGFLIQMAALSTLTRFFGWHYVWASLVAIELAIVHNFIAHSHWTWRDRAPRTRREWTTTFGRYQLAKSASLAANLGMTAWLVNTAHVPVEAASAGAVLALSIVNFLVADAFVFNRVHTRAIAVTSAAGCPDWATGSNLATAGGEVESCDSSSRRLRSS
jgi:putative flippase GtrA